MTKKKLLIFHPALAPYRIDQFNSLSELFDLTVVFIFANLWNHKFNQTELLSQVKFKYSFLLIGPQYKGRVFRFGMLHTIKKINPDIILAYEYSFTTLYLILLKYLGILKQKLGSSVDDSIDICIQPQSKIRHFARKIATKQLDFLVLLSLEVSSFYQDKFRLPDNQLIISPILQNAERLRSHSNQLEAIAKSYVIEYSLKEKKVLLFVGRFIHEKALSRFIISISTQLHEHQNLIVVLVGDGVERKFIEALIVEKELKDQIILPGRIEGKELYAWYLCASGFVLPSTYEPFGAVVNEALIFGLKVLCSKYAGASILIKPDNGILFDPLSKNDTCSKLLEFSRIINQVDRIDMKEKPSLMSDHQNEFINEWGKILND